MEKTRSSVSKGKNQADSWIFQSRPQERFALVAPILSWWSKRGV